MKQVEFHEILKVGFIQTNLDNDLAWGPPTDVTLHMKEEAEFQVWQEIKKGFHKLYNHSIKPDIIVMPEVTLPLGYKSEFRKLAQEINAVVFAGLDFITSLKEIKNKAILIVPNRWFSGIGSSSTRTRYLGKKYPAFCEQSTIDAYHNKTGIDLKFSSDDTIYLIDGGELGQIGFAICSDFYDLERYVAYKGRVQHIIILAYNKDTNSFFALAEAIARLVMCNVIICNTGKFGDSLVFSPYKDSFKRMIFRNQGANLFATQVVSLPVRSLVEAQKSKSNKMYKLPPGYELKTF